jgi:hypothetical protein
MAVTQSLADRFRKYVEDFGSGQKITAIHLFGVEHGESLQHLSTSDCKQLALKAGFKESLGTELHKGIRLSKFAKRK